MKRDMDLIRKILLIVESSPSSILATNPIIEGHSPEEVGYHCHLLVENGLAQGANSSLLAGSGTIKIITGLTWKGHDFIEKARDDTRWNQAKAIVKEKAGPATIEVFSGVLGNLIKAAMGIG